MLLGRKLLRRNRSARGSIAHGVALKALLIVIVGLAFVHVASAQNVVRLTPATSSVELGSTNVALDLEIDFTDVTTGGGVEVTYDATRLTFISFTFSGDTDPAFDSGPAPGETAQPLVVGAGWFIVSPPFGVSGLHTIGTFLFEAVGAGSAAVTTSESPSSPGPFFGPGPGTPLLVNYEAAAVDVAAAPNVPTAGLITLSLSMALLLLVGVRMTNQRQVLSLVRFP